MSEIFEELNDVFSYVLKKKDTDLECDMLTWREKWESLITEWKQKADKWDQWSKGHYRMTTRERLRELTQIEKKFKAIKKWAIENKEEYLDMQDWDLAEKILGDSEFKEKDEE